MGLFERYLTLWVALGMGAGVGLGLGHVSLVWRYSSGSRSTGRQ